MPTIPLIQDSAQLETSTGRQSIQADANAFGGQEARGASAIAQGLGAVAQVAEQKDDEFDAANARELDNELNAQIQERLRNPENGYLNTRGVNALDARDQVGADIDGLAAEIGGRARSPRARALYEDVARRRVTQELGNIAEHASRQSLEYQNEVAETAVRLATDNAVAGYADPTNVQRNILTADGEIARIGARMGWGADVIADRQRRVRSDISSRVIVQMATTDPEQAQAMYEMIRPSLTAQDAAELQTTMRAAQRESVERMEGLAWQAFANNRPLNSMGATEYQEFTTNPLYGQAHAQIANAYRVRAQSFADGAPRARDNSPAYISAILAAERDASAFAAPGALEAFMAENAETLSPGDMVRLINRRSEMNGGDGASQDVSAQRSTFNALRDVAAASLGAQGFDLRVTERSPRAQRQRVDAFDAALQRETQRWLAENNGQSPAGEDIQIVIGRAIVGMRDADLGNLPEFRVDGNRGRTAERVDNRGTSVAPTTEAVVPYAAIPEATRLRIGTALQRRIGRVPTQGEVENAYAAYLQGRNLNEVIR